LIGSRSGSKEFFFPHDFRYNCRPGFSGRKRLRCRAATRILRETLESLLDVSRDRISGHRRCTAMDQDQDNSQTIDFDIKKRNRSLISLSRFLRNLLTFTGEITNHSTGC
jgi:hypothetical protein